MRPASAPSPSGARRTSCWARRWGENVQWGMKAWSGNRRRRDLPMYRRNAIWIRLKFGELTHYGPPQAWLNIGHTLLNFHCFLTSEWSSSVHAFGDESLIWLSSNLAGKFINGIASTDALFPLQWRHDEHDGVSNHQPHHCLLNRLFRRKSNKTSKLRVTVLCVGNSPMTGEFPSQMASKAENISIGWHHHALKKMHLKRVSVSCQSFWDVWQCQWWIKKNCQCWEMDPK